jgi:hypothetical protein
MAISPTIKIVGLMPKMFMKIKNIALLIFVLFVICLATGCVAKTPTTDSVATTPITQPSTSVITIPNEEITPTTPNQTEPAFDKNYMEIMPEFIEYDEKYQELKTLSNSAHTGIIAFPSTRTVEETFIEEFYTAEEFGVYLNEYSDLLNHQHDEIAINDDGFLYKHGFSTYKTNFIPRFFFLSSNSFQPLYCVEIDEVKYDEESQSIYVILVVRNTKHSNYEINSTLQEKIDANTQATYVISYLDIDEYFKDTIKHIYFVLPQ